MDKDELTAWALANGWRMIAGRPSLTKPSSPDEAIVRMALKATVVNVEVKKPAGRWEKVSGAAHGKIQPDPEPGCRSASASTPSRASRCSCRRTRTAWSSPG
jgi:hypothetical protein